jgi:hypothetical protein
MEKMVRPNTNVQQRRKKPVISSALILHFAPMTICEVPLGEGECDFDFPKLLLKVLG